MTSPNSELFERIEKLKRDAFSVYAENTDGCSGAKVIRIGNTYLKVDKPGSLRRAYEMQVFLHKHGLAPAVIDYESTSENDCLVMECGGESAISKSILGQPTLLTVQLAEAARRLHNLKTDDCPIRNRTAELLEEFDRSFSDDVVLKNSVCELINVSTPDEVYRIVSDHRAELKSDTVIHGDMCLPNFLFSPMRFTGFIDIDGGGIGDRHYDLFWALWSMTFNFKTQGFNELFLNAYGREDVDYELIRACGCLCAF